MSEKDDKIIAMVEQALKRDPKTSTDELQEKAKAIDPAAGKLTRRQFHAKYPLQVKRRLSPRRARTRRRRRTEKVKASTFAESRLDEMLTNLTAKIREDFDRALKKDSLQAADDILVKLSKLRRSWDRK